MGLAAADYSGADKCKVDAAAGKVNNFCICFCMAAMQK
jgi:hypothetical protein